VRSLTPSLAAEPVAQPGVSHCPALFIAAPASGQGKTSLTAALARYHRNQGRRVQLFKCGPDYLDPMILERAAGRPVYQLDLWMTGEADCRARLHSAAESADLILVEGVMGLFDGSPSGADLAQRFDIPVVAIIDARAMAQTFGALAHGLASYRTDVKFHGVLANRVGSAHHAALLRESLPESIAFLGQVPHDAQHALPSRHLGLHQAEEIADLDARLDRLAAVIEQTELRELPPPVEFTAPTHSAVPPLLDGVRIGIARDSAFSFIYQANLDLLQEMGAELHFFSPLADERLPEVDTIWLPGGYPELHLDTLATNSAMKLALHAHHAAGKPLLAECGGLLYLCETLTDQQGHSAPMVALLPGHAVMQQRLTALGPQSVTLKEGELRGHTFHHSRLDTPLQPFTHAQRYPERTQGEAVYRGGRLHAGYLHHYFPSNPHATAALLRP
jgi:cobyrinic acid a,c-diamide synthase